MIEGEEREGEKSDRVEEREGGGEERGEERGKSVYREEKGGGGGREGRASCFIAP